MSVGPEVIEDPVSTLEKFGVLVHEESVPVAPSRCGCGEMHLFRVAGDKSPGFTFTSNDSWGRGGEFLVSFGPFVVVQKKLAHGESLTITSEQLEEFQRTPGEGALLGSVIVAVRWDIDQEVLADMRYDLKEMIGDYLSYLGQEMSESEKSSEVARYEAGLDGDVFVQLFQLNYANSAGLALQESSSVVTSSRMIVVPLSLAQLFADGSSGFDSKLLFAMTNGRPQA